MDLHRLTTTTRSGLPVVLSPFTAADIERVRDIVQDPEIPRWTFVPSPYSLADAESFVGGYAATAWQQVAEGAYTTALGGPELVWGVSIGEGSDPSGPPAGLHGSIGLRPAGDGAVEIGWWLGPDARGHGVIRAAVALLIEVAFSPETPIRARAVHWHAFLGNLPSAVIAQRTGFRYTGIEERLDRPHWSAVIEPGDPIAPRDDWPQLG